MQTSVNLHTATENIFVSTVLLPHKGKCTGEYTGTIEDGVATLTCPKCGAVHVKNLREDLEVIPE